MFGKPQEAAFSKEGGVEFVLMAGIKQNPPDVTKSPNRYISCQGWNENDKNRNNYLKEKLVSSPF